MVNVRVYAHQGRIGIPEKFKKTVVSRIINFFFWTISTQSFFIQSEARNILIWSFIHFQRATLLRFVLVEYPCYCRKLFQELNLKIKICTKLFCTCLYYSYGVIHEIRYDELDTYFMRFLFFKELKIY